jgi:hypothetical protein
MQQIKLFIQLSKQSFESTGEAVSLTRKACLIENKVKRKIIKTIGLISFFNAKITIIK